MTLGERFRRWRATRGYGVHSPQAFRLIGRVVRPPKNVVFYGEEQLLASRAEMRLIRRARVLLRLVAELQPAYVWTSPGLPPLLSEAIRLAGCVVRVFDGAVFPDDYSKADLAVLYGVKPKKGELKKMMAEGKTVAAFNVSPKVMGQAEEVFSSGVLLLGTDSFIAVNTRGDAPHSYRILLP